MQDRSVDIQRLSVLLEAAVSAGQYFAARLQVDKKVTQKTSAADVVTEVDKACEDIIRRLIEQNCPGDEALGEEGTAPGAEAAKSAVEDVSGASHLWIIDPLDGTTNFVSQIPLSVVSLAYAKDGRVTLAAIYDPYRDELFYGVRGAGAWLAKGEDVLAKLPRLQQLDGPETALAYLSQQDIPGTRLAVSTVENLRRAIVSSGFPTRADDREKSLINGMAIVRQAKSLRGFGAAALHLAYVAAGRIEGFWEYDLNAWDIAAGSLLVEEAGGVVTDINGDAYNLAVRNVVACGQSGLAETIRSQLAQPL